MAGQGHVRQRDRLAELAAGSGILIEARSRYERVSSTGVLSLNLRFPRELLPLGTAEITEACARSVDDPLRPQRAMRASPVPDEVRAHHPRKHRSRMQRGEPHDRGLPTHNWSCLDRSLRDARCG
jgi:hypothetical protein